MPYVNVRITKDGATAEQKRQVISGVTDVLVKVLGKNPDTTFVVIDEVDLDNWGMKGTSIREIRGAAAAAPAKPAARKAAVRKVGARKTAAKATAAKAPAAKVPAAKTTAAAKPAARKAPARKA